MAVFRNQQTRSTAIPVAALQDSRISNAARGLLVCLLSFPDEWEFSMKRLTSATGEPEAALKAQMQELMQCGYVTRDGRAYTVHEHAAGGELAAAPQSLAKVDAVDVFLELWNANCGRLPQCRTLTKKRRKGIQQFISEVDDPEGAFVAAVREVASDPFWLEKGYNIDNLLVQGRVVEKAEKHMAGPRADRKVVEAVQRASSFADRIRARRANQS